MKLKPRTVMAANPSTREDCSSEPGGMKHVGITRGWYVNKPGVWQNAPGPFNNSLSHSKYLWVGLVLVLIAGLAQVACCAHSAPDNHNLQSIHSFITNWPPINNLVLEANYLPLPNGARYYQFRRQSNAFFARKIINISNELNTVDLKNSRDACGYWEEEYWALEQHSRQGWEVLHTHKKLSPDDTKSTAYQSCRYWENSLGMFTSFGISEIGENAVEIKNGYLECVELDRSVTNRATLFFSNGLPVQAKFKKTYGPLGTVEFLAEYRHNTNVVRSPIPAEILLYQLIDGVPQPLYLMRVVAADIGSPTALLSREYFFPPSLFTNYSIRRVVHTNGADFFVMGDTLVPTDMQTAMKLYNPYGQITRGKWWFFFIILAITTLVGVIWAFLIRRKPQKQ